MEVRFPVRADGGLRAAVCSCMVLDRDEGYNRYLFSLRIAGTFYGKTKRRSQIVFSLSLFIFFLCLKCFHFSVAVTSELARHQKEMLFGVTSVHTLASLCEVRDYHLSSCCFPRCCLFGLLAGSQPKVRSCFSRDSSLLAAG